MREIKFRGKRIDNGEWVHGSLLIDKRYHDDKNCQLTEYYISTVHHENGDEVGELWCVDLATVGQFIGINDIEDNNLYEGDIIRMFTDKWIIAVVRIEYGIPIFTSVDFADTYEYVSEYLQYDGGYGWVDCELIGNIHDNPELLEERRDSND